MTNSSLLRLWSKLAHPNAGVSCALFTAGWCGFGSALGRFAPNFHHRHVAGFWLAPRWHTVWVFVLLVAIAVWCTHGAIALRGAYVNRKRHGGSAVRALGLALVRVALLFAFGAYAWFVIASRTEEFAVTAEGTNIHGEFYRALRVEARTPELRPWQSPAAWLVRQVGTATEKMRVERGKWWPSRVGRYDLAMARARLAPRGAIVRHGGERVTLDAERPTRRGLLTFILRAIHRNQHAAREVPNAEVEIGGQKHVLPLDPEWAGENTFIGMRESPVILLRVHKNLTRELATLAFLLLAVAAISKRMGRGAASRANS